VENHKNRIIKILFLYILGRVLGVVQLKHFLSWEVGMVEFVSYDGRYPNLCHGVLVLRIDWKLYAFLPISENAANTWWKDFWNGRACIRDNKEITKVYGYDMVSGGYLNLYPSEEEDEVTKGEWEVNLDSCVLENNSPFLLKSLKREIEMVVNKNVEHGCCGGCL